MNTSMASDHPFQMLFETLGRIPTSHAESVNRQAYEILSDILTVPVEKTGRCILLRAPRAGHGKTHLLSRIQHYLGSSHEFIPLHPAFGCRIDAASVTDDALRRLVRPLPASGGLCVLDLVTRRLFAAALQPLVGSGEVPCQDREGALSALRTRPIETFDFHHPNAVTAHWARENFEVLGQRLSLELAQRCSLPVREISFWVDALFRFAATPVENPGRVRALAESARIGYTDDGAAMERLEALLGLVSLLMRVVLVADDLEGFSADETAALRLAAFLGSLRQSVERLDVILSLNQDIWQSAFVPRLSGGLADRLSEVVIELSPLTDKEMVALLDSRVPGLGSRVLERLDVSETGTHARGLIRAAGMAWLKATAMDSVAPSVAAPVAAAAFSAAPAIAEVIAPKPEPVVEIPAETPVLPEPELVAEVIEAPVVVETPAAVETSPFTMVAEVAPVVEEPASWPAPEFSPAPPVEIALEPPVAEPIVEPVAKSPFQISSLEPVFEPLAASVELQETAPAPPFVPQPVNAYQPQVESPFQVETPVFTPEPAPVFEFNPPPTQSPFQEGTSVFAPEPTPVFEFNPPPTQSPFQVETPVFTPEPAPAMESSAPPVESPFQPAVEFNPPPINSPFQPANPVFIPEQPAASFTPSNWETLPPAQQPVFNPPVNSPFQMAEPAFTPEPVQTFNPPPVESPFQAAPPVFTPEPPAAAFPAAQSQNFTPSFSNYGAEPAPAFQPSPEPAFVAPAQPAEPTPPPAAADTDRVDDLLRQFRERYGRGSL